MPITPTGYANHIQPGINSLLFAILNARMADNADARDERRHLRAEASAQRDRDWDLAMTGARAGHAVPFADANESESGVLEAVLAAAQAEQAGRQADAVAKRRRDAFDLQRLQRQDWRDDKRLNLDTAKTWSGIADTHMDNIGAVLEGLGKRFTARSGGAPRTFDPSKAWREAVASFEISNRPLPRNEATGDIDWTSREAQDAIPQIQRRAATFAGLMTGGDGAGDQAPVAPAGKLAPGIMEFLNSPAPPMDAESVARTSAIMRRGAPPSALPATHPVDPDVLAAGQRPVDEEFITRHIADILAVPAGPARVEQITARLERLKRLNPPLYAAVRERLANGER